MISLLSRSHPRAASRTFHMNSWHALNHLGDSAIVVSPVKGSLGTHGAGSRSRQKFRIPAGRAVWPQSKHPEAWVVAGVSSSKSAWAPRWRGTLTFTVKLWRQAAHYRLPRHLSMLTVLNEETDGVGMTRRRPLGPGQQTGGKRSIGGSFLKGRPGSVCWSYPTT